MTKYSATWAVFLITTFLTCGCRHVSEPFFPIGIYSPGSTNNFPLLKAVGFNTVVGPAERGFLDAAHRFGLKVLASPGTHAGPKFNPAAARRAVRDFDSHPALWSWYLADEPDMHGIPPIQIAEARDFLRRICARKPTSLVLYNGFEALPYADIPDLLMIDRYPIPWAPLSTFDQHVRLARHAAGQKKPLMAVLQAFDWSYYPEQMPEKVQMRPPTYEELRCMVYSALMQGANGLFFYPFNDGKWNQLEHPETWSALQRVVAEINERKSLFTGERVWWNWRQHVTLGGTTRTNETSESSVIFQLIRARSAQESSELHLLALNLTAQPQTYTIRLGMPPGSSISEWGGNQRRLLDEQGLKDKIDGYGIKIYGPFEGGESARSHNP